LSLNGTNFPIKFFNKNGFHYLLLLLLDYC